MNTAQSLVSINPATGEPVGSVTPTPLAEIANLVATAQARRPSWSAMSLKARGDMLKKAGQALLEQAPSLGLLLSQEMGKPLKMGVAEVEYCGTGMADKIDNIIAALQPVVTSSNTVISTLSYRPVGVVCAISPWNFPVMMPHKMLIPALMAGNTVILKPSEETPLAAQAYVNILNLFLPKDVLQIVQGGRNQGKMLVEDQVNMVSFTGSRTAGIDIMQCCSKSLKRLVLELGGKDPLIVLADADIDAAAQFAVDNSFDNAGQQCISTERVFVDSSIADQFEKRVTDIAALIRIGRWDQADVDMGPMIHNRQRQIVIDQINQALSQGARALLGGTDHPEGYVTPTVLTNIKADMDIARNETFGPVVVISRFDDVDEAIRQANDTVYGLSAVVFGGDAAEPVAEQLEAGMIGINKNIFAVGDTPWVGAKQSGFGYNGSPDGYRQFTQARVTSKNCD